MTTEALKKTSENYWQQLVQLPQLDAIFQACEALEEEALSINRERVREKSGVTYNNLLAAGIRLYRERQHVTHEFEKTPTVLLHLVGKALENAFGEMTQEFERHVAASKSHNMELAAAAQQDIAELEAKVQQRDVELMERDAAMNALIEDKALVVGQLTDAQQSISSLEQKVQTLLSEQRELQQQLVLEKNRSQEIVKDHRLAMAALTEEQAQHTQSLTEQHDKEINRLMTQLGNERGEWKAKEKAFNAEMGQAKKQLSEKQGIVDEQAGSIVSLNKSLQEAQAKSLALGETVEQLNDQNQALQQQLGDRAELQMRNQQLFSEVERLKQELNLQQALFDKLPGAGQWADMQAQLSALQDKLVTSEGSE